MNSCLYQCSVMHQRLLPLSHGFVYRLFYLCLDLDELPLFARRFPALFSTKHAAPYRFHEEDHIPSGADGQLKQRIIEWMRTHDPDLEIKRVALLTLPRVLGYVFNPISIYFAWDATGKPAACAAEVGNTFLEKKLYFIPWSETQKTLQARMPKLFYVSPFSALDIEFDFRIAPPGDRLAVHIDDYQDGRKTLVSSLTGCRRTLHSARLVWYSLLYPLVTLKVITLIHWQALRLWWKGAPHHRKEAHPELQQEVQNPHRSLRGSPSHTEVRR